MSDPKLRRWQQIILATLFTGYTGYYICRANLSVATPLLLDEFKDSGIDEVAMGWVTTIGVGLYALGKITNGLTADFLGGRIVFILGMAISVCCTVAFGMAGGLTAFAIIWGLNRYVQSGGWVSLVKIASRWYPVHRHATVMGILSMSYLLGNAFALTYLGLFLKLDAIGWREVFFIAAATTGVIAAVSMFLLKSSPHDIGAEEPSANAANIYGLDGERPKAPGFLKLLGPLMRSPTFWLCCLLNFGLTLIRETFNFWTPTYLVAVTGVDASEAAIGSTVFPLVGAASAFLAGTLSDRLGGLHGRILLPSILLLTAALAILALADLGGSYAMSLVLLSAVSFFLIAPYSFLSGVIALDLGGKVGSSTTAGLLDSAGYVGAMVSGVGIGAIAKNYGWSAAFGFLAGVCALTAAVGVVYWIHQERTHKKVLPNIIEQSDS